MAGARLTAVVCLRSAAAHYGCELKTQPARPELMVRRGRKLTTAQRAGVAVRWANLADDQVHAGVTTPLRTDLDGLDVRGAGAAAVRRVLAHADGRAANPFESVLRALCIEVGLVVEPQMVLDLGTGEVRPDLVCLLLRLVIEADSWTVMHDQAYVRWVLAEAMRSVGRPEVGPDLACPA